MNSITRRDAIAGVLGGVDSLVQILAAYGGAICPTCDRETSKPAYAINSAMFGGRTQCVRELATCFPSVVNELYDNRHGMRMTLLHQLCCRAWAYPDRYRVALARALLDSGADANLFNICGETALHLAIKNGFRNLVRLLISTPCVDVNASTGTSHYGTPLFAAYKVNTGDSMLLLLSSPNIVVHDELRRDEHFQARVKELKAKFVTGMG